MAVHSLRVFGRAGRTINHIRRHSNMCTLEPTVTVEVERKFLPTAYLQTCFTGVTGYYNSPYERSAAGVASNVLGFYRLPDQFIRDTYYDHHDQLSKKGIWIRRRTSHNIPMAEGLTAVPDWEAKVRIGGVYTDSKFLELQGESKIRSILEQHLPSENIQSLSLLADLVTRRKTWIVHEHFKEQSEDFDGVDEAEYHVVVDEVTTPNHEPGRSVLCHQVGEVELTKTILRGADVEADTTLKRAAAAELDAKVEEFMGRYRTLFPTSPRPKGKLSAYFEWRSVSSDGDRSGSR